MSGKVAYGLEVFHVDRPALLDQLEAEIDAELHRVGLHKMVEVKISTSKPSAKGMIAGVCLGSPAAAADSGLDGRIVKALAGGMVVVPVVDDLANFQAETPPCLHAINGFGLNAGTIEELVRCLFETLGLEDHDRRVFISHRREDGMSAAVQLHDELSHHGFHPFIDRFYIPKGERVQDVIADSLEDFAFLLLLETPLAHTSDWVLDEVDYALAHSMGLLIVRWPGDPAPVDGTQDLPRMELDAASLVTDPRRLDTFTPDALAAIVHAVEMRHAVALVRRRRTLMSNIEDAARASSSMCTPLPGWRALVEHSGGSTVVGISPRLPRATDLHRLDEARVKVAGAHDSVLVHSARVLTTDRRRHLNWVINSRSVEFVPDNAIGARWLT
jgi:hypothetical protein